MLPLGTVMASCLELAVEQTVLNWSGRVEEKKMQKNGENGATGCQGTRFGLPTAVSPVEIERILPSKPTLPACGCQELHPHIKLRNDSVGREAPC